LKINEPKEDKDSRVVFKVPKQVILLTIMVTWLQQEGTFFFSRMQAVALGENIFNGFQREFQQIPNPRNVLSS